MKKHNRQEAAVFLKISLSTLDRMLKKYNLVRLGWGSRKLDEGKADNIRSLYASDKYTQGQLSKIFHVSRETINKVINNKIYPFRSSIGFGGSADVRVTYYYTANLK